VRFLFLETFVEHFIYTTTNIYSLSLLLALCVHACVHTVFLIVLWNVHIDI